MQYRIAILLSCTIPLACASAEPTHPWEVRHTILQPVDAGRADLNELSTSNFVTAVDLRLPTRFERVYRLSDVLKRGSNWNTSPELANRQDGFVRFSGGVAAVFSFSRYTNTSRGRVSEIPDGTVFRLDLRPPSPTDVTYSPVTSISYNAVSLGVSTELRNLRDDRTTKSPSTANMPLKAAAARPVVEEPVRSLWTDELFRGRMMTALLEQTIGTH